MDKPGGGFAGLKNFIDLFHNKAYLRGLFNTLRFILLSVPLNMGFSLALALLIHRVKKHRELFTLFFLIPLVIPSGSMVFFWRSLFSDDGVLNGFLWSMNLYKLSFLDSILALFVMIAIFLWKNIGYNMVLYLSALSNIPKDYYEAAHIDGAGGGRIFLSITLPALIPVSVLTLVMSIINSFKIFREIYLITGTYPHESIYTLQHFMNNMFASLNYPRLTTATIILVFLIASLSRFLLGFERKAAL
jgi:multiple sugar transport system permease protein